MMFDNNYTPNQVKEVERRKKKEEKRKKNEERRTKKEERRMSLTSEKRVKKRE